MFGHSCVSNSKVILKNVLTKRMASPVERPSVYSSTPSNSPSSSPSMLCLGLVLTLFTCSTPRPASSAETSTPLAFQWNASGTVYANQSGVGSSQNFSAAAVTGATTSSSTAKPSSASTPRTTTPAAVTTTITTTIKASSQSPAFSMKYGIAFPLNMLCTFLQLYVSLFGRRMQMNGLRWFTIYYNLWNVYQMLVVSDTTEGSPWLDWLSDARLVANKTSLELLTMSIFPLGVILLLPMLLLSHFCFCCPLRWLPWLPLFLVLSLLPTFLYNGQFSLELPLVKGNATLDMGNGTSADVLDVYAFLCISFAFISVLYFVPILFLAIFFFLCYLLLNRFNPKSNHSLRASRILDLLLLLPFLVVVLAVHLPTFVVNLSGFFILNIFPTISPYLLPLLSGTPPPTVPAGNSTAAPVVNPLMAPWMMDVLNVYNQVLLYKDCTQMFLPAVEFLASLLFIRMYREQYLALLSCYACYKDDTDGACGTYCLKCCCPCFGQSRLMISPAAAVVEMNGQMVQPQDPLLWAQPVKK